MEATEGGAEGGYECIPVEDLPDELTCPICLLPAKEPHLLSCCGKKLCYSCISRVQYAGQPCPICREAKFNTMIEKEIERRVLNLKVYCNHKDKKCTWIGELRQLEQHSQSCLYRVVSCTHNCGLQCTQIDMFVHERDACDLRPAVVLQKELDSMKKELASRSSGSNTPISISSGPNYQEKLFKVEQELEALQLMHSEKIAEKNEAIRKLTEEVEASYSQSTCTFPGQCKQKMDELSETIRFKEEEIESLHRSKDEMEQELGDVTVRVQQIRIDNGKKKDDIKALQNTVSALKAEKQAILAEKLEVETQLRTHCSQLEERQREEDIEALQMAYEDIEKRLKREQKINRSQESKIAEAEERQQKCHKEYERLAAENVNLKKTIVKVEQELAAFQLTREERIVKNEAVKKLTEEVRDLNYKLTVTEKANAGMEAQEEAMKRSIESLNVENEQLKRQLQERPLPYSPHAANPPAIFDPRSRPVHIPPYRRPHTQQSRRPQTNDERVCPICHVPFPSRVSQADYERHVNRHFQ